MEQRPVRIVDRRSTISWRPMFAQLTSGSSLRGRLMRIRLCCVLLLVVATACIAQETAPKPRNLEQTKTALAQVFAARSLSATLVLKNDLLTVSYKTAKFMVPERLKIKVENPKLHEEEGPQADGIMMRIGMEAPGTPHAAENVLPSDLLGGLPPLDPVGFPWRTAVFDDCGCITAEDLKTPGRQFLHVLLEYGPQADRTLIRTLLNSIGVALPQLMSVNASPETIASWGPQKDYFLHGGFRIVTWDEAKSILLQNNYVGGRQYHTGWLTLTTKDGGKYLVLQPSIDLVFTFLKGSKLPADGFATE